MLGPIGAGIARPRDGEKPAGPQGVIGALGLAGPQVCAAPTGAGAPRLIPIGAATLLGAFPETTSSSSAAKAEDPRIPFGLGERREGDPDPELAPSPDPLVVVGRAMGAIGRVIGPGPAAPSACGPLLLLPLLLLLRIGIEARRPCPGASIDGPGDAGVGARGVLGLGGPMGEGAPGGGGPGGMPTPPRGIPTPIGIPRLKFGSNGGPVNPRGRPDGVRGVPGG